MDLPPDRLVQWRRAWRWTQAMIRDIEARAEQARSDAVEIAIMQADLDRRLTAQEADRTIWRAQLVCPVCGYGQQEAEDAEDE